MGRVECGANLAERDEGRKGPLRDRVRGLIVQKDCGAVGDVDVDEAERRVKSTLSAAFAELEVVNEEKLQEF